METSKEIKNQKNNKNKNFQGKQPNQNVNRGATGQQALVKTMVFKQKRPIVKNQHVETENLVVLQTPSVDSGKNTQTSNRVFNRDTQKSMCVKSQIGNSNDKVFSDSSSTTSNSSLSNKRLRRKQNRTAKRRSLAKQNSTEHKTTTNSEISDVDHLKSLADYLALVIESQLFNITSLNKFWDTTAKGFLVSCPCGKHHYPFNKFCDLEQQIFSTYNEIIGTLDLLERANSNHTEKQTSKPTKTTSTAKVDQVQFTFSDVSEDSQDAKNTSSVETVVDNDIRCLNGKGELKVPYGSPSDKSTITISKQTPIQFMEELTKRLEPYTPGTSKVKCGADVSVRNNNSVATSNSRVPVKLNKSDTEVLKMGGDKDLGLYGKGDGSTKRLEKNVVQAVKHINLQFDSNGSNHMTVPLSRPVIDNLYQEYEDDDREQFDQLSEISEGQENQDIDSNGFTLKYKPAFWQFWRTKSIFNSVNKFNHNSHYVRRVAKTNNLDYTNLPDNSVIDSLYSYLTRRRLATYPNYNAKLEHLHKLAKSWESENLPLSKNIASAVQLNNYYLTIGKVANSTDIDMLLSKHHEDKLGRRKRFVRWITGRTVETCDPTVRL